MSEYKLGAVESKFADIIWSREPVNSTELVKICAKELSWKKSTTYTILRRLCERGIFANEEGMVRSVISRQEFFALQSEQFVEEAFAGSLPQFLTAFTMRKNLSEEEIHAIQKIIDEKK